MVRGGAGVVRTRERKGSVIGGGFAGMLRFGFFGLGWMVGMIWCCAFRDRILAIGLTMRAAFLPHGPLGSRYGLLLRRPIR